MRGQLEVSVDYVRSVGGLLISPSPFTIIIVIIVIIIIYYYCYYCYYCFCCNYYYLLLLLLLLCCFSFYCIFRTVATAAHAVFVGSQCSESQGFVPITSDLQPDEGLVLRQVGFLLDYKGVGWACQGPVSHKHVLLGIFGVAHPTPWGRFGHSDEGSATSSGRPL